MENALKLLKSLDIKARRRYLAAGRGSGLHSQLMQSSPINVSVSLTGLLGASRLGIAVYEIRNCLVHAGGDLRAFAKTDVIGAFAQRRQLTMCRDERIELEDATAKTIARVIYAFLEGVYDAALVKFPGHYGRRKR